MPIRIVIAGIAGNMGRVLADAVRSDPRCVLIGGYGRASTDAAELLVRADIVLDFTSPGASAALAEQCAARGGPALVIGSTGFAQSEVERILVAAQRVPIVRSGSFSLGINVLLGLVRQAAQALQADAWDVEILEAHHRRKVDAPSGTALMLGGAAAAGRGAPLAAVARKTRGGMAGHRTAGEIGFSVLRGGSIVGDHSVTFAGQGERVSLGHVASDRSMFAAGAIAAAHWIGGREPGHYDMLDVLGF